MVSHRSPQTFQSTTIRPATKFWQTRPGVIRSLITHYFLTTIFRHATSQSQPVDNLAVYNYNFSTTTKIPHFRYIKRSFVTKHGYRYEKLSFLRWGSTLNFCKELDLEIAMLPLGIPNEPKFLGVFKVPDPLAAE